VGAEGQNSLHGEEGNDVLVFNPGRVTVWDELANTSPPPGYVDPSGTSVFNGGNGYDTLRVVNEVMTVLNNGDGTDRTVPIGLRGQLFHYTFDHGDADFGSPIIVFNHGSDGEDYRIFGRVENIERFEFSGHTGIEFKAGTSAVTLVGTDHADFFLGSTADDTIIGGRGNDHLEGGLGDDTIRSRDDDADIIEFDVTGQSSWGFFTGNFGSDTVTGFNGESAAGGDTLVFVGVSRAATNITTANGWTTFTTDQGTVVVDAVNLEANIDYFFA
jgi:Ca2+-binding RTX toxin-like protein